MRYGIGHNNHQWELQGANLVVTAVIAVLCVLLCIAFIIQLTKKQQEDE